MNTDNVCVFNNKTGYDRLNCKKVIIDIIYNNTCVSSGTKFLRISTGSNF